MKTQLKCNIHPNYEVSLLRFHKDIKQVLSCSCCVEEQDDLIGISTISFQKMMDSNESTYFTNWPPFEKEDSQNLKKQLSSLFGSIEQSKHSVGNDIRNYFKELRIEIEKKISAIESRCLQIVNNQHLQENNLIKEYNQISKKLDIQQIIKDNNKHMLQKNVELKQIVDEVMEERSSYTKKMQKIVKKVEDDKYLNLSKLEKVKSQIIGNLDLFYQCMINDYDILNDEDLQANFQTVSQILRNQFNQCQISFVDSFEQAIVSNFYLFKDIFQQQQVFKKDYIKINYDNLSEAQYTDILQLAKVISNIPPNTQIQSEKLRNTKKLFDNYLTRISQQYSVQNLLIRYPIFELVPEIKEISQLKPSLIKSDYNDSGDSFQILSSNTLYSQVDYSIKQLQAYCDFVINPQLKYLFKIELSINNNRKNLLFGFGLGRNSLIHDNVYEQGMMYFCDGKWGIDKVLKGKNLNSLQVSSKINSFLIKVCLQDNILEVSDLLESSNVVSIDQTKTNLQAFSDLRFFINLPSKYKKGDWIKISSIETVDFFN